MRKHKRPDLTGAMLRLDNDEVVDLSGMDLSDYVLNKTYLHHANLSEAIFTGAHLSGTDLGSAILDGTTLDNADVKEANFDAVEEPRVDRGKMSVGGRLTAFPNLCACG